MTFTKTGITAPHLLKNLEKIGFTTPTPIQEKAIPLILSGKNVVGVAHTGTGKTLAFALPLIQRLMTEKGALLVLAPSRELAMQLDKSISLACKGLPLMNITVLISGVSHKKQIQSLRANPRIIIGTPGRINEHLDSKTITLKNITTVVFDEADRMLDSGFAPQIERIIARSAKVHQVLMFSATMSNSVTRLVNRYAPEATWVQIPDIQHDTSLITQERCKIKPKRRIALLTKIIHNTPGKILIFATTKKIAEAVFEALTAAEFDVAGLHGNRTVAARAEAIDGFHKNRYRIMVATDLASRGIDVPAISLVVNYDVPREQDTYLHRIGRTGRAGEKGRAITFVTPEQTLRMKHIESSLKIEIGVLERQQDQAKDLLD